MGNDILAAAMDYASQGFYIVPILPKGKRPLIPRWPEGAAVDEEVIISWWDQWPHANVGVVLGKKSGIIDVECDSKQAEKDLLKLFGDELVPTPTYKGKRGKHRLFRWRDDLPATAVLHIGDMEFRTGGGDLGAQSVFPPSIHSEGVKYTWLVHPSECDIAELPTSVVKRLWNLAGESLAPVEEKNNGKASWFEKALLGVVQGGGDGQEGRNNTATKIAGILLGNQADLSDFIIDVQHKALIDWNKRNRPPLPEKELDTTFQSILSKERLRRTTNEPTPLAEPAKSDGEIRNRCFNWGIVVVNSEPRVFRLRSPLWAGDLSLVTKQLTSYPRFEECVLEEKCIVLPRGFRSAWMGTKKEDGMLRFLVSESIHVPGDVEVTRSKVILQRLLYFLKAHPTQVERQTDLPTNGYPAVLGNGDYYVRLDVILSELSRSTDKIERSELWTAMGLYGRSRPCRIAGEVDRRVIFRKKEMEAMRKAVINASQEGEEEVNQ